MSIPRKTIFDSMTKRRMKVICLQCKKEIIVNVSDRRKYCSRLCRNSDRTLAERISLAQKGRTVPKERRERLRTAMKILWQKSEYRNRMVIAHKHPLLHMRGKKSHFWMGGLSRINDVIRHSSEYKLWREQVYKRDDYTCQECGVRGGKLNADHIKPFSLFPELRFDVTNGRTLCVTCHRKTDTWGINQFSKRIKWQTA